jgi:hypothetical protein
VNLFLAKVDSQDLKSPEEILHKFTWIPLLSIGGIGRLKYQVGVRYMYMYYTKIEYYTTLYWRASDNAEVLIDKMCIHGRK